MTNKGEEGGVSKAYFISAGPVIQESALRGSQIFEGQINEVMMVTAVPFMAGIIGSF